MAKQKEEVEYRYYEMPEGHYVLALLGDQWVRNYAAERKGLLHFHNYTEIGFNYWGDGNIMVSDGEYPYRGDVITYFPPNVPHSTESKGDSIDKWEFLFIDLEGYIRNEMQPFTRLPKDDMISLVMESWRTFTVQENPIIANLIIAIMDEYRNKKPHYKNMVKGFLRCLVVELLRAFETQSENTINEKRVSNSVENSIKYVQSHFSEEIRIEDIAAAGGLSESHFRRQFEESMGIRPLDYVNMIRIDKACELLRAGNLSIEEIAFKVGFVNISTFNRNFKKLLGTSPLLWRNASQSDETNKKFKISVKKGW